MPLWGATDADESKPKHLTTAQKKEVYANASGWVVEAGSTQSGNGNTSATPEVLVAIGSLATSLGSADITAVLSFVLFTSLPPWSSTLMRSCSVATCKAA